MRRTLALIALPLIAAGALLAGCGPKTSSGASAPDPAALADADGSADGDGAAGDAFCTVLADRAKVIAELTVAVDLENPADDAMDDVNQIVAAQTAIAAAAPPQL